MKFHDEFDDDFEDYDDGEAFDNIVIHIGQGIIDHLLAHRAKKWPAMDDRDFLPVLDTVRTVLNEFLSPNGLKELWDYACWRYFEDCQERDPGAKQRVCDALLAECLPEWHRAAAEVKPPPPPAMRRKRKGNR